MKLTSRTTESCLESTVRNCEKFNSSQFGNKREEKKEKVNSSLIPTWSGEVMSKLEN